MRTTPALVLPALVLTLGCTGQATGPLVEHPLQGTFEWVHSSGGIAWQEFTPGSVGYDVRFEYTGTRVRTYRNDQPIDDTRFTVREDVRRESGLPVYVVTYEQPLAVFTFSQLEGHTVQWAGKALLVLDEGCCDRYTHTITRPDVR